MRLWSLNTIVTLIRLIKILVTDDPVAIKVINLSGFQETEEPEDITDSIPK
jgi:hypothetical protein